MNRINKKLKISMFVATIILFALSIICAVIFWPKATPPKTTKKWLEEFSESLETATRTRDKSGDVLPLHIVREIKIQENHVVVATYKQLLQINVNDGIANGYLSIEERYPVQETSIDDICDEYYFADGVMYTMRTHGEEVQTSKFDSEIGVILTVASENIGNSQYNLIEEYLAPTESGKQIIRQSGDVAILSAVVKPEKYDQFFGRDVDDKGLADLCIEMKTVKGKFESLALRYMQDGKNTEIMLTLHGIVPITVPEWVRV